MEKTSVNSLKEKIKKIEIELIHHPYIDGWQLQYLKDKKAKLEKELIDLEK